MRPLQIGKQFVVSTHVEQNLDNNQNDFLWTLMANPATDAHLYAYNLQRLVNDFPQSGMLQALLAHASDNKNLRQASVYFNPRSLFKLINSPASFVGVPDDRIVIQPGIGVNGYAPNDTERYAFDEAPADETEQSVEQDEAYSDSYTPRDESPDIGAAHHLSEQEPAVEEAYHQPDIQDEPQHLAEHGEHHLPEDHQPVEGLSIAEDILPETEAARAIAEETTEDKEAYTEPSDLSENPGEQREEVAEEISPSGYTGEEPEHPEVEEEPGETTEVVAHDTEEHIAESHEPPEATETEAQAGEVISGLVEEPVAEGDEHAEALEPGDEPSPPEEHAHAEHEPTPAAIASTESEEPIAHTEEDAAAMLSGHENPEQLTTAGEEQVESDTPVSLIVEEEQEAVPETLQETPVAEAPVAEQELTKSDEMDETFDEIVGIEDINFNGSVDNFFSFEQEYGAHQNEDAESNESLTVEGQAEAEQLDVSKYNDDKMPYSFMWWLDKTRKEHEHTYQPYVKPPAPIPVKKTKKLADELQQQYFENIFHITSVEELDKSVPPSPQPAVPGAKKKEQVIIERFIKEEPQIRPQSSDKLDNENKAKKSSEDRDELVTETLAAIYSDQMLYHKAISSYKKLMLKFPEKSRYFAEKIEALEKKTN